MDFLYLTADRIGAPTGGGQVTGNEWQAMQEFRFLPDPDGRGLRFECEVWSFPDAPRPWGSDDEAASRLRADPTIRPKLAHIYAGCFTDTVRLLKERGCKVTYTVAAHDRHVSREEHEALGLPFDYPHLVRDDLWRTYIGGILAADVVVVPGEAPRRVLEREGVDPAKIRIIPHGHNPPNLVKPLPARFVVGYLGSPAPDKGLRYLLAAWKQLNEQHPEAYREAVLVLAGPGTEQLAGMVRAFGGGNVVLRGWVRDVSDLYGGISLYVQPSATEGFGIECVEAAAHGRPVICSDGAGAAECADARIVVDKLPLAFLKNAVEPQDVGAVGRNFVRGPVEQNDDVLGHEHFHLDGNSRSANGNEYISGSAICREY